MGFFTILVYNLACTNVKSLEIRLNKTEDVSHF